jgi:poly-gamma-glutamate synthesis protein (capsule biosynthesis protein)
VRIVNLETPATSSGQPEEKRYTFRMHPGNITLLQALALDVCSLANNHAMDWGRVGLLETLGVLASAGLRAAGAGRNLEEAQSPVVLEQPNGGRVLVFSLTLFGAGSPMSWRATQADPGLWVLPVFATGASDEVRDVIRRYRRERDIVVVSVHWGGNWGHYVSPLLQEFAHSLIDAGDLDLLHGHSSHHVKPIEVYKERLILYGCGDLINDYLRDDAGRRWQTRHEKYRPQLVLGYFAQLGAAGELESLVMSPFSLERLRLERANLEDREWLREMLSREGLALGTGAELSADGTLRLTW